MTQTILKRTLLLFIIAFVISGALALGYSASGAEIPLQVPILGKTSVPDFAAYILLLYKFFVGSVGLIAVVMIMIGGFQWIMAAGNSQRIESAKETIFSAIAGLVIALGSYTILFIINPNLTTLKIPALPSIKPDELKDCSVVKDNASYECGKFYEYNASTKTYKASSKTAEDVKAGICMGTWCGGPYPKSDTTDPNFTWKASEASGCTPTVGKTSLAYECLVIKCPNTPPANGCFFYTTAVLRHNQGDRGQACNSNICGVQSLFGKGCTWLPGATRGCTDKR